MTRDLDQCCGMSWERKVVEVAEGRNVDGKSRGGLLTKLGLYTLAFGSEASEQVVRCWGVVCATNICESSLMRRWTPGTGVLQVRRGRFENLYCAWVETFCIFSPIRGL